MLFNTNKLSTKQHHQMKVKCVVWINLCVSLINVFIGFITFGLCKFTKAIRNTYAFEKFDIFYSYRCFKYHFLKFSYGLNRLNTWINTNGPKTVFYLKKTAYIYHIYHPHTLNILLVSSLFFKVFTSRYQIRLLYSSAHMI